MLKIKKKSSDIIADGIIAVILIAIALVCILPMWHVIMAAISKPKDLYASSDFLFRPVGGVSFEAWSIVWKNYPILRSYFNTILYTVLYTGIGLLLTLLGAYVLSRKDFLFRNLIFVFMLLPMFVNAGMIPQYVVNYKLRLTNTIWALVLPGCCTALNVLMGRVGMQATDA